MSIVPTSGTGGHKSMKRAFLFAGMIILAACRNAGSSSSRSSHFDAGDRQPPRTDCSSLSSLFPAHTVCNSELTGVPSEEIPNGAAAGVFGPFSYTKETTVNAVNVWLRNKAPFFSPPDMVDIGVWAQSQSVPRENPNTYAVSYYLPVITAEDSTSSKYHVELVTPVKVPPGQVVIAALMMREKSTAIVTCTPGCDENRQYWFRPPGCLYTHPPDPTKQWATLAAPACPGEIGEYNDVSLKIEIETL